MRDWAKLRNKSGTEITDHYFDVLRTLGEQPGILGDIYSGGNPVSTTR